MDLSNGRSISFEYYDDVDISDTNYLMKVSDEEKKS